MGEGTTSGAVEQAGARGSAVHGGQCSGTAVALGKETRELQVSAVIYFCVLTLSMHGRMLHKSTSLSAGSCRQLYCPAIGTEPAKKLGVFTGTSSCCSVLPEALADSKQGTGRRQQAKGRRDLVWHVSDARQKSRQWEPAPFSTRMRESCPLTIWL